MNKNLSIVGLVVFCAILGGIVLPERVESGQLSEREESEVAFRIGRRHHRDGGHHRSRSRIGFSWGIGFGTLTMLGELARPRSRNCATVQTRRSI